MTLFFSMRLQNIVKNRLLKHVLFWIVYLLAISFAVYSKMEEKCFKEILGYQIGELVYGMIMAYWISYHLLTEKNLKKGIIIASLQFVIMAYVLSALSRLTMVHLLEPIFRTPPFTQETPQEILFDFKVLSVRYVPGILTVALIFYIVKYFSDYNVLKTKRLQFEKEKTETELKILRAQLNPHFLFNTLNNIYSLSIDNSPKTSSAIGKLSEILDYILYKCDTKVVLVSAEMKLIDDYIELEKLRYDDRLKVELSQSCEMDNYVPPLLFLSLVENAFKHGAGEDYGSPKIWINLESDSKKVSFKVVNTYANFGFEENKESIGIKNIRKQLELLYVNQYELLIKKEAGLFTVILTLENIFQDES